MATQVKKVVSGPFTALPDAVPGVQFVGPGGEVFGAIGLMDLKGMTDDLMARIIAECPMLARLAVHAKSQKVGDSYASASEAENPLTYVKNAITETIEQIRKNEWRVTGGGGGRVSLLARALARVVGKTVDEAQSVLDNLAVNDEDTEELKAQKKATMKQIRGQDAIKKATLDLKDEDAKAERERLKNVVVDATSLQGLFGATGLPG